MYNTINHFAEPGFRAKALAEFFTSRAHTAEQLLSVILEAVDNELPFSAFLTYVESTFGFSRNACIIVDDDGVLLRDVLQYVHSVSNDPVQMTITWDTVDIPSVKGMYVSVAKVVEKLTALTREGYISAAGFTVISQEGTIADFRDIVSERIASAYQDTSGQLGYWASMIRSKLDQDVIVERVLSDMTPQEDDEDYDTPPAFSTTQYAGLSSASPVELAGLELSILGVIPSVVGKIFEAYYSGVTWVLSKIISLGRSVTKKVASGFLPYEAVVYSGGKAGTFKYGAWYSNETVNFYEIPRSDQRWTSIDNTVPINIDETLAVDLKFGQFLFTCQGTTDQVTINTIFKPKVIIPTSNTVMWGSKESGEIVYPPDPIKTLSSISNIQAYKSIRYAALFGYAVSNIALQEMTQAMRPSGAITLVGDDPFTASASDIAHLLGDSSVAVDFISGYTIASAMREMIRKFAIIIASFLIEKKYYPVDYDFLPYTSSMVGWEEYSYDLTSEEDAQATVIRNTTNALLVAAAVALSIKYGPVLAKSIKDLYARSISKSFSSMSKAASGTPLTLSDIRNIRRAGSRVSLLKPTSTICPIELSVGTADESEYARLYSLIAGVYP